MKYLLAWLRSILCFRLVIIYVIIVIVSLVVGWFAFYFPVYPLYSVLGREFSNLGPIATFSWGVLFVLFIVTPIFVLALLVKALQKWVLKA